MVGLSLYFYRPAKCKDDAGNGWRLWKLKTYSLQYGYVFFHRISAFFPSVRRKGHMFWEKGKKIKKWFAA